MKDFLTNHYIKMKKLVTKIKIFLTYIKKKISTGEVYVGRTSGEVDEINRATIAKVLDRRDSNHQKNKEGFDKAEVDKFSEDSDAIRGREDMLIAKHKAENKSGNKYRGISLRNKRRTRYLQAAIAVFGTLSVYIYFFILHK